MLFTIIGWIGFYGFSTFMLAVSMLVMSIKANGETADDITNDRAKSALYTAGTIMIFVTMMLAGAAHAIFQHIR